MNTSAPSPIVSIIIPTTGNRIIWLQRAVKSALTGWNENEIEILIILNNNENKLSHLKSLYAEACNVKILNSHPKGVSRARNIGLHNARGSIIRFLDDDDYLYPDAAVEQCKTLLTSESDLSSYSIDLINDKQEKTGTISPLEIDDCVVALALPNRLQIPLSFIFKRELIQKCKWQENLSLAEDAVWLLSVLCIKEVSWIHSNNIVGVWYQHQETRLSRRYPTQYASLQVAKALVNLNEKINLKGGLNASRKNAIATALWQCYIDGFKYNPIKWASFAQKAIELDSGSKPNSRYHLLLCDLGIPILVASWILLPLIFLRDLKRSIYKK